MMELIVNVSADWGIGRNNELLVSLHADLKRFREITSGHTVILGRKTLQTFPGGRPLKNRRNIILSTSPTYIVEGAEVAHSLAEVFSLISPEEMCYVIGGESVYRLLLPYCTRALVTKSYGSFAADRFFPDLDADPNWQIEAKYEMLEENGVSFQYIDYVNLSPLPIPGGAECTR